MISITENNHTQALQSYYRWHASIYDITRWSFLFGRGKIIEKLPELPKNARVLEVGCGTGHNIHNLTAKYPRTAITGIDLSPDMVDVANQKTSQSVVLLQERYENSDIRKQSFDLILFSYTLTMMETSTEHIINQLKSNLTPNGIIAVVDFHQTDYPWFHRWMRRNHVEMSESLLSSFKQKFNTINCSVHPVYLGLWSYFLFIGTNDSSNLGAISS